MTTKPWAITLACLACACTTDTAPPAGQAPDVATVANDDAGTIALDAGEGSRPDATTTFADAAGADAQMSAPDATAADAGASADAASSADAGQPPMPPVDCSAIEQRAGWELCSAGPSRCTAVFEDRAGCAAVCAAAGLECARVFENIDDTCGADTSRPELSCTGTGHMSDYCVCVRPNCQPSCTGLACGDDGCGGSCGECTQFSESACVNGACTCTPLTCASAGLNCGSGHDDGCGGTFDCNSTCPGNQTCTAGRCQSAAPVCTASFCPAFPGAEGEGMFARGGRGGDVYHVTSTGDSGAGTLREALSGTGARTIVFDRGGTIDLRSPIKSNRSRLTIAGQTAPGDGITVRGYQVELEGSDLIVRHIRFRAGDSRKKTQSRDGFTEDSLTLAGKNVIVDHVSASWGIDENLSSASNDWDNITVQYSIVSEGLHRTRLFHGQYDANHAGHSMGSLFKPRSGNASIAIHHNLYAHNNNRNPAIGAYNSNQTMSADIRNNVIYNCRNTGYTSGEARRTNVNYVGNFMIWGRDSTTRQIFRPRDPNNVHLFQQDNLRDIFRDGRIQGRNDNWAMYDGNYDRENQPFNMRPVTTHPSSDVLDIVLNQAGARPWNRDAVDVRVVADVRAGTGEIIDSPSEVGGHPNLARGTTPTDTDRDGMPDDYERTAGTNPNRADNNGDVDGDGYTNLENYLHWAARLVR